MKNEKTFFIFFNKCFDFMWNFWNCCNRGKSLK